MASTCADLWEEQFPHEVDKWDGHSCKFKRKWGQCDRFQYFCAHTCDACNIVGHAAAPTFLSFVRDVAHDSKYRLYATIAAACSGLALVVAIALWALWLRRRWPQRRMAPTEARKAGCRRVGGRQLGRYMHQLEQVVEGDEGDEGDEDADELDGWHWAAGRVGAT